MRAHFAVLMWLISSQSDTDFEWLPLHIDEGAEV